MPDIDIKDTVRNVERRLRRAGIENAANEGVWIFEAVTGLSRTQMLSGAGPLNILPNQAAAVEAYTQRRIAGEPLQYILGEADFRGWLLQVGPGVLIPRPETELLVDFALDLYPGHGMICDMCTGSGTIAIALAGEIRSLNRPVVAVDISGEALGYAEKNIRRHKSFVSLMQGDLFSAIQPGAKFQLITANPPYVAPHEFSDVPADVRNYEPREALLAEEYGTECIKRLLADARQYLAPGGWLLSEIGEEQGDFCRKYAAQCGYTAVEIHKDLAGRERILAVSC